MITIKQLADKHSIWADEYYRKPSGRPTREADNLATAMKHALHFSASLQIDELRAEWLPNLQQLMVNQGLARTTINARVRRIRRVFRWGVRRGIVPPATLIQLETVEPLKRGRTRAVEPSPIQPVAEDQVLATAAAASEPVRSMVMILWWTGMRVGELVQLRPADVDRSDEVWKFTPREHKTEHHGQARVIALGPRAQAELAPWLEAPADDPFLFPSVAAERLCFSTAKGTPWNAGSLRQTIRRVCDRRGLEPWTPLQLRHAAATRLRKLVGIEAARTVLGHRRLATTEIYAERDLESAADAMQLLG